MTECGDVDSDQEMDDHGADCSSCDDWRHICSSKIGVHLMGRMRNDEAEGDEAEHPKILEAAFDYALEIWWDKPNAIYRYLSGSVDISEADAEELKFPTPPPSLRHGESRMIRRFVPKQLAVFSGKAYEVWTHSSGSEAAFYPGRVPESPEKKSPHVSCSYKFLLSTENERLSLFAVNPSDKESRWLQNVLFSKILSWIENCDTSVSHVKSLRLVDLATYTSSYNALKGRYAQKIIHSWTETTNPEKFVHEDLAIAAYLLLKGYGVDVRKRKIWDTYDSNTVLLEKSLNPKDPNCLMDVELPKCSWLIGNHSDELTPWIPVLAARMSANIFLLPCCSFDFHGKFQRRENGISRYRSYLNYIKEIGERIGFRMKEDRMKTPSTKRVCFIGTLQSDTDITANLEKVLHAFVTSKKAQNFLARPSVETVKNCTQVDKNIRDRLVNLIAGKLLEINSTESSQNLGWNCGGTLTLAECSGLLTSTDRKALKGKTNKWHRDHF